MAEEAEFMVPVSGGCPVLRCYIAYVGRVGRLSAGGESGGHAPMVSVLGFMTWIPVHPMVGISTKVTSFKFKFQMTSARESELNFQI